MPETTALVACEVPDYDMAERLLADLVRTKTLPSAIELVTGSAWPDPLKAAPNLRANCSLASRARKRKSTDGQRTPKQAGGNRAFLFADLQGPGGRATDSSDPDACRREHRWPAALLAEISVLPGAVVESLRLVRQLIPEVPFSPTLARGSFASSFRWRRGGDGGIAGGCGRPPPARCDDPGLSGRPRSRRKRSGAGRRRPQRAESIRRSRSAGILNPERFGY